MIKQIQTDWTKEGLNSLSEPHGEVLLIKTPYESDKEISRLCGAYASPEKIRVELEDWACFHIESKTQKETDSLVDSINLVWFNKAPLATITFEDKENHRVLKSIKFEMEIKLC